MDLATAANIFFRHKKHVHAEEGRTSPTRTRKLRYRLAFCAWQSAGLRSSGPYLAKAGRSERLHVTGDGSYENIA